VSTTLAPAPITSMAPPSAGRRHPLVRTTVAVGALAAAGATAVAAALHAAGVSLTVQGETIPLAGFAQMTFLGAVLGGIIVAVLNRRSAAPHTRFLQTAVVLTTLSCVPSIAFPSAGGTKVALVVTHLVAAAIIVPVLARQAHD